MQFKLGEILSIQLLRESFVQLGLVVDFSKSRHSVKNDTKPKLNGDLTKKLYGGQQVVHPTRPRRQNRWSLKTGALPSKFSTHQGVIKFLNRALGL